MKKVFTPLIKLSLSFIILMGLVSLFSDMTHEGANSILGDFLSLSGATPAAIGFLSGFGMLIGYGLRLLFGYIADKTKKYWLLTIIGYIADLIFIPLLFFVPANGWLLAAFFVTGEKIGKAIKKPAKDTLISFASKNVGSGKGFALGELIDQLGAFLGPVLVFSFGLLVPIFDQFDKYRYLFLLLGIPALVCFVILFSAKVKYPAPELMETPMPNYLNGNKKQITKTFVFFLIAIGFFAFAFVDYSLILIRVSGLSLFDPKYLPLLYGFAMIIDALSAFVFGIIYDKIGIKSMMIATFLCAFAPLFVFTSTNLGIILTGVGLWGLGMGAIESVLKAIVADLSTKNKRSLAFGVFDVVFGVTWFLGSWGLGYLYQISPLALVITSLVCSFLALVFYLITDINAKKNHQPITQ